MQLYIDVEVKKKSIYFWPKFSTFKFEIKQLSSPNLIKMYNNFDKRFRVNAVINALANHQWRYDFHCNGHLCG